MKLGVLQGSAMAPLLFNKISNDLFRLWKNCKLCHNADYNQVIQAKNCRMVNTYKIMIDFIDNLIIDKWMILKAEGWRHLIFSFW